MKPSLDAPFLLFEDHRCLLAASAEHIAAQLQRRFADPARGALLVFDADTGTQRDLDLSLGQAQLEAHLREIESQRQPASETVPDAKPAGVRRGPGRPRLGVVSREVTLLPRHWTWLNEQPGGASVSLRKLVEQARRASSEKDQVRKAQERCYRFINTLAGNLSGFEEACRALYAADAAGFDAQTRLWPVDIRKHALRLAAPALGLAS